MSKTVDQVVAVVQDIRSTVGNAASQNGANGITHAQMDQIAKGACTRVGGAIGRTSSTVLAKCSRDIGLTMPEFYAEVWDIMQGQPGDPARGSVLKRALQGKANCQSDHNKIASI